MSVIVGICHHCEILRHVDAADENGFDIVAMSLASKGHPGIIMAFRVFFKGGFWFNVFPIGVVVGDQGRSSFLCEFEREAGTGFQESRVKVRSTVEIKFDILTESQKLRRLGLSQFP